MLAAEPKRVGYVVEQYPRLNETVILNEILAHELAGLEIEIFSLRPPNDAHFQDRVSLMRAPVTYVPAERATADGFWEQAEQAGDLFPEFWTALESIRGENALNILQAIFVAREVRARKFSHLHAQDAKNSAAVACLAARFAGISYSVTAHARDIFQQDVQPDQLQKRLSQAAAVMTDCDFNRRHLHDILSPSGGKVHRVYNGLDIDDYPFDIPNDRPSRIVAVGRLIDKKGFGDLIEACGILAGRNRHFTCQIIGGGELEPTLRAQIRRLGLQSQVELLGLRPQGEVIQAMRHAAVFAVPSVVGTDKNRDGLPMVLVEAMALGTPCVSTGIAGIPEVIRHEETGLIVPQHSPTALARAMDRLLLDPALRVKLARRARDLIEREFDIHSNITQIHELFHQAGQSNRKTRAATLQRVS